MPPRPGGQRSLTEEQKDARDLRILALLDEGYTQAQAGKAVGVSRGPVARLVAEIRENEG